MDRRNFFGMFAGLAAWAGFKKSDAMPGWTEPSGAEPTKEELPGWLCKDHADIGIPIRNGIFRNCDVPTKGVLFLDCVFDNCTFNGGSKSGFPINGPLAGMAHGCVFMNNPGYAIQY